MAFPTDMVYIRLEFSWVTNQEIQDTGFWAHLDTVPGNPLNWATAVNSIAAVVAGAWKENWGTVNFSNALTAMRVVVYHYDQPLKKVLDRGEAAFTGPLAWAGSATNDMPPENTIALSLYGYDPATFVPDRARKRGRMYLPTFAFNQIVGGGWLSPGAQASWLLQAQNFFADVMGPLTYPLDATLEPVVVSRGGKSGAAAEGVTNVQFLRVGRIIDTQRRRRNKLPEQYVTGPI